MSSKEFFLYSIVEGQGERESLPKLLHKIWGKASLRLRTDEKPCFMQRDIFLNNEERRRNVLNIVRHYVRHSDRSGVLILMDADTACCKEFLRSDDRVQSIKADIEEILGDIPHVFVLIERKYESWLAAGLGDGGADAFLKEYLGKPYKKTKDQIRLIRKMDIEQAAENNPSFRRFRERLLEWRGGG